jgi:hypothetical protein
LALAVIKKSLQDRGPSTLRFASLAQNFKTLQQFLLFVEGFMRGKEDVEVMRDKKNNGHRLLHLKKIKNDG